MNWLIESKFATEDGYPSKLELNTLKILSGSEVYPTETCILRSSIGAAKDVNRLGLFNIKTFLGYEKDSFDANRFMTEFGDLALNKDHCYLTLGQVKKIFKNTDSVFCRPVSGWKKFAAGVLNKEKMYDRLVEEKEILEDSVLCLVSKAQQLDHEYRIVVAGKEIVGQTEYLPEETSNVPQNVIDFANEVISKVKPPDDIFVLDIALVGNEPRALEWNSFTTSGLYLVDIPIMCSKIEEYLIKLEEDYL